MGTVGKLPVALLSVVGSLECGPLAGTGRPSFCDGWLTCRLDKAGPSF